MTLPSSSIRGTVSKCPVPITSSLCWSLDDLVLCLEGQEGNISFSAGRQNRDLSCPVGLAWWDTSTHHPACLLTHWRPQMGHKCRPPPQERSFAWEFSSKSTLMCHQGGLCSCDKSTAIKASFHLRAPGLLRQDPTIPPEAWFTILTPCFYRAWFCEWNWWRPQPRVTESSGVTADSTVPTEPFCHTPVFSTRPWRGLLRLQMRSISCFSILPRKKKKKIILLIWAHFPYPIAVDPRSPAGTKWLMVGTRQSCVGKLRLWGGWWGIVGGGRGDEKGRKKECPLSHVGEIFHS